MRKIGGILGRNPFGPAHEHLLKVLDCIGALPRVVGAAISGDRAAVSEAAKEMHRLEFEADNLKNAIRMQFTTSIFASVNRSELLALVKAQDDVADECDRLAHELDLRPTRFPSFLEADVTALVDKIASVAKPLSELSRLLDQSGGRINKDLEGRLNALLDDVQRIVTDVEPIDERLMRLLFEREGEMAPLDVVFVVRFAEHAGKVAKKLENAADVLSRLVMETKE